MWVTAEEAAKILGKSACTVRRMAKKGQIPSKEEPGIGRGGVTLKVKVSKISEKTKITPTKIISGELSKSKSIEINEKSAKNDGNEASDLNHPEKEKNHSSQPLVKTDSYVVEKDHTKIISSTSKNRQITETYKVKENGEMSQGGVTLGVTKNDVSRKSLDIKDIDSSFEWIPIEQGVTLAEVTKRTLYRKIEKRQINSIVVPDPKSGKRTYVKVSDFSPYVQMKWHEIQSARFENNLPAVVKKEKKKFEIGRKEDRDMAWARLSVIKEFYHIHELCEKAGKRKSEADKLFLNKMEDREILASELRVLGEETLGLSTVKRWVKAWKDSGNLNYPVVLVPQRKGKVGRKKIKADDIRAMVKSLASEDVMFEATGIYKQMLEDLHLTEETCPMRPTTIYAMVRKYRKDVILMNARKGNGESYKNKVKPHLHRINDCEPNDIWESDGHRMNNICYNPFFFQKKFNPIIRPILMAWFDVATGMITGWALYYSETFHVMVTSFANALGKWGPPRMVRMDNGSAFKNAYTAVNHFAFKKNKTKTSAQKNALELHRRGFRGFFQECGVEKVQFVIAGNAESKQIEPAWRYLLANFEKSDISLFMGEDIARRPEKYNMSTKALIKKYGKQIPTWNEYCAALERVIDEYNNTKRDVLTTVDGGTLSPMELFSEFPENIRKQSQAEIDRNCKNMFPEPRTVTRNEINIMGMYYRHPLMSTQNGRKVNVYYDEKSPGSVRIGSLSGEIWHEPAKAIVPSCHMNPDQFQLAIQDNSHYHKEVKATYAVIANSEDGLSLEEQNKLADKTVDQMLIETEADQERIKHNQKPSSSSIFSEENRRKRNIKPIEVTEVEKAKEEKPLSPFQALSKSING